jgi:hypothetical protein
VTFRRNVRLNPGQVRDLRGAGGGGRRFGLPGGFNLPTGGLGSGGGSGGLAGGGIGTIILLVVIIVIVLYLNGGLGGGGGNGTAQPTGSGLAGCQTGQDANERLDCRIVGFVNSIQAYWTEEYARQGRTYQPARTVLFTDVVDTGCGQATSAVGPFYCPVDKQIYIDLGFFTVLEQQYGASAGPLAQAYVIAHEYGHHVQNIEGTLAQAQDGTTGPTSGGVRVELQADCFAGVWTGNAVDTGYLEQITQQQVNDALSAAAAVGDDRIQQQATGQVEPHKWTHGSSDQRQNWFITGYNETQPASCDTFSGWI